MFTMCRMRGTNYGCVRMTCSVATSIPMNLSHSHSHIFPIELIGNGFLHSHSVPFPHGQFPFLHIPILKQSFNPCSINIFDVSMTCARGTRRRPYPAHLRIFGACYWCLLLTSPAVLLLRYAACICQSVAVSWSAAVGWEVSQSSVVS